MADQSPRMTLNSRDLAEVLGVDVRSVQKMNENGILTPARIKRDLYDFLPAIKLAVTHYREMAANRATPNNDINPVEESARLRRAQRQVKETELQVLQGALISTEDLFAAMADHIKGIRAMVLAFPMAAQAEMPHLTAMDLETLGRVSRELLKNNAVRMIQTDGVPPEMSEKIKARISREQMEDSTWSASDASSSSAGSSGGPGKRPSSGAARSGTTSAPARGPTPKTKPSSMRSGRH